MCICIYFYRLLLSDLPIDVLIIVLNLIELQELLTSVNRVCKRFNNIIKTRSVLWTHVSFPYQLEVSTDDLKTILSHSNGIADLDLPCTVFHSSVPEIDRIFTKANFKALDYLNLSDAPISTLCFLFTAPNLRILNLSGCKLLVDEDFQVLKHCNNIEQLYLSFTKISQSTLQYVCFNKPLIVVDACNIPLDIIHCRNILLNVHGHLVYFHITLDKTVDESAFKEHILNCFMDTSIKLYKNHEQV